MLDSHSDLNIDLELERSIKKFILPDDIIKYIREYSSPITRGDWRRCGKINTPVFNNEMKKYIVNHHFSYKDVDMYTIQIKNIWFWYIPPNIRRSGNILII
jgi:hypothetical protein